MSDGHRRRAVRQQQTRLSGKQVDQLVAEYRAGASKAALARQFEVSDTTVRAHLARRQVESRAPRKLHGDQLSEAVERYGAGESIRSLALSFGLSRFVIRSGLEAAGVSIRASTATPPASRSDR